MTQQLCIYHAKCTDGYAAAWIIHRVLGSTGVDFHEGYYGAPPPNVDGRRVIIVDFSYPRDVMMGIIDRCEALLVLDHHKTAEADLASLCPGSEKVQILFDMSRSGAGLTWDYSCGGSRPWLIDLVETRDLWRRDDMNWEKARLAHAYVNSFPFTFNEWDEHMRVTMAEGGQAMVLREGAAILRQHDRDVEEMIGATKRRMKIGGYDVPVANLGPMLASDAGHLMSKGEPFSASYFDGARGRLFSLRSADDGLDVSEIAKSYGGGGHAHAAGFKVELGWNGDP